MAKIAVALERALAHRARTGEVGAAAGRVIARGDGWSVADVICTSGPHDRPFEERHHRHTIAIVAAGTFQYRCAAGAALMAPGTLMLGTAGGCYECGHEHGAGDRCISFWFTPEYFERVTADTAPRGAPPEFRGLQVPPLRETAGLIARACAGVAVGQGSGARGQGSGESPVDVDWESLGVALAVRARTLDAGAASARPAPPGAEARVTRAIRRIERQFEEPITVSALARDAGLSPYHFLRTFERLTGLTPHQFLRRLRLRDAAIRLADGAPSRILDIALACGFGDASNFTRAFRVEFGMSPREHRRFAGDTRRAARLKWESGRGQRSPSAARAHR